jgi:hypothetical protein
MYEIGWTNCQLTDRIAEKQGGVPLIRGTRVPGATDCR